MGALCCKNGFKASLAINEDNKKESGDDVSQQPYKQRDESHSVTPNTIKKY